MNQSLPIRSQSLTISLTMVIVASALPPTAHAQGRDITITDLGSDFYPTAVSEDGSTVVGEASGRAYRWTEAGGLQVLSLFASTAWDLTADGNLVVGGGTSSQSAFRWTASQGAQFLSGPLPLQQWAQARGVSLDGSVVVGQSYSPTYYDRAFVWRQESGMISVAAGHATGVSGDGSTVVGEAAGCAFRWTTEDGLLELGTLPGGDRSLAYAISTNGQAIVGISTYGLARVYQGFHWTQDAGMRAMGFLSNADKSWALACNGDGTVAVGRSAGGGVSGLSNLRAFIWLDADSAMFSLKDYLLARGVDVRDWNFTSANGISGTGGTIVGVGTRNRVSSAFLIRGLLSPSGPQDTDHDGILDALDNCVSVANSTQADCDGDGVGDACELADGAADVNGNLVPDACECIADVFVDGQVNGADLGILLNQWGLDKSAASDINRSGTVDGADLSILLNSWGACP